MSAAAETQLQKLAQVAHAVRYEDLPAEVVARTKLHILDTLGCAYGACGSEVAQAVRGLAADCGGTAQATVIGTGERISAPLATLVNGGLLRFLDGNDYYFARDPAHPSGNLAAILAVAEREGRGGRDVIAALVAAYEVQLRLCDYAGTPSLWKRGWHHATNQQFSAAAAAARLLGCTPMQMAHAMAIAGSHHNTLAQLQSGSISMIKATAEAWVAKGAVEAALLARHGMTGPLPLLEGNAGWAQTVAGEVDFAGLTAPLDGRYRLMETSIKPYPVVATATAPVRAAIELHRLGLPALDTIHKLVVRLPRFALNTPSAHAERRFPENIESAQHSFYFCAAIALLEGACGEAQFAAGKYTDATVRQLLEKVELAEDAAFNELWPQSAGGGIDVVLKRGTVQSHSCPFPPGHPRNALSADELAHKFHEYADPVLSSAGADKLYRAVLDLDRAEDLRAFATLLAPHHT
ncbi:MAG TPA: MmgE/PrpD family protein [Burkholderiales bacterium]|jgi:2-methylcitrate dehydratase